MKWNQALNLILSNITLNLDLDPSLRFKIVIDVPPFQCRVLPDRMEEVIKYCEK